MDAVAVAGVAPHDVSVEDCPEALDGLRCQLDLDRDRSAIEAESDEVGTMAGLVVPLVVPPRDRVRPRVEREQLAAALELAGRTVSHAAIHATPQWCAHQVGAGSPGARTGTPATATPTRVATNRQPSPRRIGYRASQPSRSSRRA